MNYLVDFFLRNYKLTFVLSLFFIIFGMMGLKKMNAESWPQVDFAMCTITTQYKGASPSDIEALITKPIEDEIRTVSGIKDVKSISQTGLSTILVRIDMDNVDEEKVMDDLQKAVNRVSKLPSDLETLPLFTQIKSDEFPAIEISVIASGEKRLRDHIADLLKSSIEEFDAVKDVRTIGYREREFTIELDRLKMDNLHIGIMEVLAKLKSRNVSIPGGDLESKSFKDLVKLEAKVQDINELSQLVIRSNFDGMTLRLGDIAKITDGAEEPRTLGGYNGQDAVHLIVNKKAGADTLKLAARVREILTQFEKTWDGKAQFAIYHDEGDKVGFKISTLISNAFSGIICVLAVLLIFMPSWLGIMTSLSLPIGVMTTFGLMPFFGLHLDSISILAFILAMGNLVDNSIVVTDNFIILRKSGYDIPGAIRKSVKDLWLPISITVLTTIASFLPMLVTKGIMGRFIRPIPIVVSIALLFSLFESFFLLPMRLALVGNKIKKDDETKSNHWFEKVKIKFEYLMEILIKRRYLTFFICTMFIFGSVLLMIYGNKFVLFPAEQTEIYFARVESPKGATLAKTLENLNQLSLEIAKTVPGWTKHIMSKAGSSKARPDDPRGGEGDSQGLVVMYASDEAKFNVPYTKFLEKLRAIDTTKYGNVTFEELINGPPVGAAITATLRSDNQDSLQKVVESIMNKLKTLNGVIDLKVDDYVDANEVKVNLNYVSTDQRGISVENIGTTLRTALGGIFISDVTLNNKEVNLNVKFMDDYKEGQKDLRMLKVMDNRGNLIPLGSIATFESIQGTPQIKRFDYKRSKTILGSVDDKNITAFKANQILKAEWEKLQLQFPDVSMVFGGVEESTKESMDSLFSALILALIGIFALLVFMFHSFLRPFIIMMTIPLGLVGFSVAFYLHDRPISFMALIGTIGLAGIIVNSGIVLIEFIELARKEGMSTHEALVKASSQRLLAVVATTLTTMAGLFPTAYGVGGSDQMLIPITLAMAWGLTSGTFFTLVFIPPMYAILEDLANFFNKFKFFKNFGHMQEVVKSEEN